MQYSALETLMAKEGRKDMELYVEEILTYIENEYKSKYLNPKYYNDVLLLTSSVIKYGRNLELWEEIGYNICKYIKQQIETFGVEKENISMLSGFGYCCYAVNEYSKTTGNLKNFSNKLNIFLLDRAEENAINYLKEKQNTKMINYDCIAGLSGALYYLLDNTDVEANSEKLIKCIEYMIFLTKDSLVNNNKVINFHISRENQFRDDEKEAFLYGNINFGLSHGMMGPLLTLSKVYDKNIRVEGLETAIEKIFGIYEEYKIYSEEVAVWPAQLPLDEYLKGVCSPKWYHRPSSWCYGNISIARGLQKISRDMGWLEKENLYFEDLLRIINNSENNYHLVSPALCHGFCGILTARVAPWKERHDIRIIEDIQNNINLIINRSYENNVLVRTDPEILENETYHIEGMLEDLSLLNGTVGIVLTFLNVLGVDNNYERLLTLCGRMVVVE